MKKHVFAAMQRVLQALQRTPGHPGVKMPESVAKRQQENVTSPTRPA